MYEIITSHGPNLTYLGIFLFLMLSGAGLPVPEEIPLVAAGYLSAGPDSFLNPYLAFAACLAGALVGDLLIYSIGRYLGTGFLRRHPRFAHLLQEDREKQMEEWISRHGLKIFFAGRFMIGIRAPLYLAAGMLRLPLRRFLLVDFIAATTVVTMVFSMSYYLGPAVGTLFRRSQMAVSVAVLLIAAGLLVFFWVRSKRRADKSDIQGTPTKATKSTHAKKGPSKAGPFAA
ncbi:MAG: DedA family protein [Pirellulales bacterium]